MAIYSKWAEEDSELYVSEGLHCQRTFQVKYCEFSGLKTRSKVDLGYEVDDNKISFHLF